MHPPDHISLLEHTVKKETERGKRRLPLQTARRSLLLLLPLPHGIFVSLYRCSPPSPLPPCCRSLSLSLCRPKGGCKERRGRGEKGWKREGERGKETGRAVHTRALSLGRRERERGEREVDREGGRERERRERERGKREREGEPDKAAAAAGQRRREREREEREDGIDPDRH